LATGSGTNFVAADGVTATYIRAAGETVLGGPYTISATLSPAGVLSNYTITYNTASFTITPRPVTVTADPQTKVYGSIDPALTYQITSGSLVTGDSFSGALARVAGENVGTYAIQQGTVTLGTNYTLTFISANLTVTARAITITPDAGQHKTYGDPDPLLTFSVGGAGLASSDTIASVFTGTLSRAGGENVANYAIYQGSLAANTNYNITTFTAGVTFAINPAPLSITPDGGKTKTYGNVFSAFTGQVLGLKFSDMVSVTYSSAGAPATAIVGSYNITVASYTFTTGSATNYTITSNVAANGLTVNQRPVTVAADAKSKAYLAADPALTYQITSGNLVNGDMFSGALTRVAGELPGTYAIQQGTLTLGPNYALSYIGANLTISYGVCSAGVGLGDIILPPINSDGTSVYQRKGGSTIPVKFRVCDYQGRSISNASAVFAPTGATITMLGAVRGTIDNVNESGITDVPDVAFRWDASGQQWIFNMATSNLTSGISYTFRINLANTSQSITFMVGVK
jgi:large repetitive protein